MAEKYHELTNEMWHKTLQCGYSNPKTYDDKLIRDWLEEKAKEIKKKVTFLADEVFIDKILGLSEPKEQVKPDKLLWCRHIDRRFSNNAQKERWFFRNQPKTWSLECNQAEAIADEWVSCPICGALRPEAEPMTAKEKLEKACFPQSKPEPSIINAFCEAQERQKEVNGWGDPDIEGLMTDSIDFQMESIICGNSNDTIKGKAITFKMWSQKFGGKVNELVRAINEMRKK